MSLSPPPILAYHWGIEKEIDMNTQLRYFVMMVYNNWMPRNWKKMTSEMQFVVDALEAMGND
jgi:hypothetical protein